MPHASRARLLRSKFSQGAMEHSCCQLKLGHTSHEHLVCESAAETHPPKEIECKLLPCWVKKIENWLEEGPVVARLKLLEQHVYGTHHCRQNSLTQQATEHESHASRFPCQATPQQIFPRSHGT